MKKLLTLVIIFTATALSSCKSDDSDVWSSVHVSLKGTLASVLIGNGLDIEQLVSLKISGILDAEDFVTISNLHALRNLDISEVKITELPAKSFYESENIRHLILPKTLTTIEEYMFYNSRLESIVIQTGVRTIKYAAFKGCTNLTSVTFEKGSQLKSISSSTFYSTSLNSIKIPASVETIGAAVFKGCANLTSVTFEKKSQLKTISGSNDSYYGTFYGCSNLATVDMSECTQIDYIGEFAFMHTGLRILKIGKKIPPICKDSAFNYINDSAVLKVPSGSVEIYKATDGWNSFANIEELTE